MTIHFDIGSVQEFRNRLAARVDALQERLGDERHIYDSVFERWRDSRADNMKAELEELQKRVQQISSDLEVLSLALAQQIRAAQEFLDARDGY